MVLKLPLILANHKMCMLPIYALLVQEVHPKPMIHPTAKREMQQEAHQHT